MATKTKTKSKEVSKKDDKNAEANDSPVLDLSDAAVKKMIKAAKKRGYITHDELNTVLPSEEVSSEQIEDIMSMLSDMGINVVEEEEVEEEAEGGDLVETPEKPLQQPRNVNPPTARMIRFACICVKWERLNCFRAKVRLRLPSALRLAAKP